MYRISSSMQWGEIELNWTWTELHKRNLADGLGRQKQMWKWCPCKQRTLSWEREWVPLKDSTHEVKPSSDPADVRSANHRAATPQHGCELACGRNHINGQKRTTDLRDTERVWLPGLWNSVRPWPGHFLVQFQMSYSPYTTCYRLLFSHLIGYCISRPIVV